MPAETLRVQVLLAERERQTLRELAVPAGCTAAEAVALSGVLEEHPGVDPAACSYGIYGKEVAADHPLAEGDRVELLRPLEQDPRERRRRLAKQGLTMGRGSARGG